jgi:hypothetical protein
MNFLPIAYWELQQESRRLFTYYARCLAGLATLGISLAMLYSGFTGFFTPAVAGRNLFVAVSCLGLFYCMVEGAFLTADCLSEEKRDGTLGLLFLTDLKSYDIVLGKLLARSCNPLYCLLAALPAPALAFFLGGVTYSDYLNIALALINTLFLSAAIGIFISTISWSQQKALAISLALALFLTILLPLIGYAFGRPNNAATIPVGFLIFSPAGAFLAALAPGLSLASRSIFWPSLLLSHLFGWSLLALASQILPRAWQEPISPARRLGIDRLVGRLFPKVSKKERLNRSSAAPLQGTELQLVERRQHIRASFWSVFVVIGLLWVWGILLAPKHWRNLWPICGGISICILHYALKFEMVAQACRGLAEDARSGVLEILLTTALGEDKLLQMRLLALKRQLLPPFAFVLIIDLAVFVSVTIAEPAAGAAVGVWLLILLAVHSADMYTLSWLGLWIGLKTRNTTRAIRLCLFYVVILPWLLYLALGVTLAVLTRGFQGMQEFSPVILMISWFAIIAAFDLGLCGWAIGKLQDDLRLAASEPFEASRRKTRRWLFRRKR